MSRSPLSASPNAKSRPMTRRSLPTTLLALSSLAAPALADTLVTEDGRILVRASGTEQLSLMRPTISSAV